MLVYGLLRKAALILVSFCFILLASTFFFAQTRNFQKTISVAAQSAPIELVGKTPTDLYLSNVHDVVLSGDLAYVASTFNIGIVDISSPIAPRLVVTHTEIGYGIFSEIDLVGNYLYILSNEELIVLDVSDRFSPKFVRRIRAGIRGADQSNLRNINNLTYLLFTNAFSILDSSTPGSPVLAYEADLMEKDALEGDDFDFVDNMMYVAGQLGFDPSINIFNISVPLSPTLVSRYKLKEFAFYGHSFIKVVNGKAYTTDGNDFYVVDVSDSKNLKTLGTFHNVDGDVLGYKGLAIVGQYAYLIYENKAVRYPDKPNRLQILNIANPSNPQLSAEYDFSFIRDPASQMAPVRPEYIAERDGLIYVGATDGLYIFRLSNNQPPSTGIITGQVIDVDKNPAVPMSDVVVSTNGGYTATTDVAGYYTLTNLTTGVYTVSAAFPGYFFLPTTTTFPVAQAASVTLRNTPINVSFTAHSKRPLLFVPGIAASTLVNADTKQELWIGPFRGQRPLSLFARDKPFPPITATDAIRYAAPVFVYQPLFLFLAENLGYREYLVGDNPSKRTLAQCDESQVQQHPNFFVFAYDWRHGNEENTAKLADYVGCIQKFYPGIEINIIAHSMGGLLTRRYILDYQNTHKINSLITIGAPWLGAPKAIYVLQTGDFIYTTSNDTAKYIVNSFPGVHQLLPSSAYFSLAQEPAWGEDGWLETSEIRPQSFDGDNDYQESYTDYSAYIELLNKKYGGGEYAPGHITQSFHDESNFQKGQDDWRVDQTDINYYHIYGVQSRERTIGSVVMRGELDYEEGKGYYWKNTVDPVLTLGDGTVPLVSASRIGQNITYNSPRATILIVQGENYAGIEEFDHTSLTSSSKVKALLHNILSLQGPDNMPSIVNTAVLTTMLYASGIYSTAQAIDTPFPTRRITVFGATEMTLTDSHGNQETTSADTVQTRGRVPGVDLLLLGTNDYRAILPSEGNFTIRLKASDKPVKVELLAGTSKVTEQVVRYQGVKLPVGSIVIFTVLQDGSTALSYDKDGDGQVDTLVEPLTAVTGTAANDVTGPEVTISSTVESEETIVTIKADDSSSGVRQIYYSTDASHFSKYIAPLRFKTEQSAVVYVVAEDNLGNRSRLYKHIVGAPSTQETFLPIVIR